MRVGALDVGTNTVLLLVAEATADGHVHRVADFSRITRLGRSVDSSGRLDPESAARTLEAIAEFAHDARALGAEKIVTAATSALRDASDGADFIASVAQRTGVVLEVVSGKTEARLAYLAVVNGLHLDRDHGLVIVDIGGGSTELVRAEPVRGTQTAHLQMASLQIGSVRLTERIVHHDPPAAEEIAELRKVIDAAINSFEWSPRTEILVGIAGTVTTVCAVALGLKTYDPAVVHGYRLTRGEVEQVLARFAALPLEQRKRLPGLVEGRADVIFAGTMILSRVMESAGADRVVVSDQGVRWGLIWREIETQARESEG